MKKVIICVVIVMLFSACSNNPMNSLYTNDKKISSDSNSYNLNDETQNIEGQKYSGSYEFEGMDTLWKYEVERDCEIDISYLLTVTKGKAKLVLISPDGTLTTITENVDNSKQNGLDNISLSLQKGENRIKLIAANKAHIEIEVQINEGEFEKLGM